MPLTPEQITELKNQLRKQIEHLPKEQRETAEEQIDDMSDDSVEALLNQQKTNQKPIFRSIVSGEIQSKKIDENKESIAVLDIRPLSKGHTIVIPKKVVTNGKDLPTSSFTLAKKIAKRISSKLSSKSIEIQTAFKFGEIIIEIIPIYDTPLNPNMPRPEPSEKEINEVESLLKAKPKKPKSPKKDKKEAINQKVDNIVRLKRRIP